MPQRAPTMQTAGVARVGRVGLRNEWPHNIGFE
ncbi:hypothetical protein B551_0201255 [Cupriavidus sp. HPC(L)]|nr:hypothetical protein B551_0201255 [Cupriavidus sp. HPC(L)]